LAAKERSKELKKNKFKYLEGDFNPTKRSSYRLDGWKMVQVSRVYKDN